MAHLGFDSPPWLRPWCVRAITFYGLMSIATLSRLNEIVQVMALPVFIANIIHRTILLKLNLYLKQLYWSENKNLVRIFFCLKFSSFRRSNYIKNKTKLLKLQRLTVVFESRQSPRLCKWRRWCITSEPDLYIST